MESAWQKFIRENNPELFEMMLRDIEHQAEWRDKRIAQLERVIREISVLVRGFY